MENKKKLELLNKIKDLGVKSQESFQGLDQGDLQSFSQYRDTLIAGLDEPFEEITTEITRAFDHGRKIARAELVDVEPER